MLKYLLYVVRTGEKRQGVARKPEGVNHMYALAWLIG